LGGEVVGTDGRHLEGKVHMFGGGGVGGEVVGTDRLHLEGQAHMVGTIVESGGEVVGTDGLHLEGSHGWRRWGWGEKWWVQMDCIWRGRLTLLEEVRWLVVKLWVQMDCIWKAHMVGGGVMAGGEVVGTAGLHSARDG